DAHERGTCCVHVPEHSIACGWFFLRLDRIFQVEDHRIGAARAGLLEALGAITRHEQIRTRAHARTSTSKSEPMRVSDAMPHAASSKRDASSSDAAPENA